jgi:hypothetical protein
VSTRVTNDNITAMTVTFDYLFYARDVPWIGNDYVELLSISLVSLDRRVISVSNVSSVGYAPTNNGQFTRMSVFVPAGSPYDLVFSVRNVADSLGDSTLFIDNVDVCMVASPTRTATPSNTGTASSSATASRTASPTAPLTRSPTSFRTPTPSSAVTQTGTPTPSQTPSSTVTPSQTPRGAPVTLSTDFESCTLAPFETEFDDLVTVERNVSDTRGTQHLPRSGSCMAVLRAGAVNVDTTLTLTITAGAHTTFSYDVMFISMDELPWNDVAAVVDVTLTSTVTAWYRCPSTAPGDSPCGNMVSGYGGGAVCAACSLPYVPHDWNTTTGTLVPGLRCPPPGMCSATGVVGEDMRTNLFATSVTAVGNYLPGNWIRGSATLPNAGTHRLTFSVRNAPGYNPNELDSDPEFSSMLLVDNGAF